MTAPFPTEAAHIVALVFRMKVNFCRVYWVSCLAGDFNLVGGKLDVNTYCKYVAGCTISMYESHGAVEGYLVCAHDTCDTCTLIPGSRNSLSGEMGSLNCGILKVFSTLA